MKKKIAEWPAEKKLEAVRAMQRGLKAEEVSALTGMSESIVYRCMRRYKKAGVEGLRRGGVPRGSPKSRQAPKTVAAEQAVSQMGPLPEGTGVGKVQGLLYRLGFLKVSRGTVERAIARQRPTPKPRVRRRRRNKPPQVRHFERARPNELWQTDIMTFMLRGQYRVYLIGFMDDNSRFLVGWGLHRRQTASNVMEVFRAAIEKRGLPKEVLSDNGRQYYTWRGKSQFTVMLTKLGIAHIRSRPYHPQTCGKIESFWRNLWQECLSQVPLSSFEEAQAKIGEYIEHYNYKRPHQGIGNMMPADRYFQVAKQVEKLVEENTAKVQAGGPPLGEYKAPTYLIGNIGGKELRMVARDAEVSLREAPSQEVESAGMAVVEPPQPPSTGLAAEGIAAQTEAEHERTAENEAIEPAGASGAGPAVLGEAIAGEAAVPGGEGVAGTVLPMAAGGAQSGPERPGTEGAGAQAGEGGSIADGGAEAAGPGPAPGEGAQGGPQGAGPLAADIGGCPPDNPAQRVGTDTQGVV
jgi:transposase InsO family protein/transposase-like protein